LISISGSGARWFVASAALVLALLRIFPLILDPVLTDRRRRREYDEIVREIAALGSEAQPDVGGERTVLTGHDRVQRAGIPCVAGYMVGASRNRRGSE
jgi:hypothetical protein